MNIRFRIVHKDLKFDANLKTLGENDTVSLGGGRGREPRVTVTFGLQNEWLY